MSRYIQDDCADLVIAGEGDPEYMTRLWIRTNCIWFLFKDGLQKVVSAKSCHLVARFVLSYLDTNGNVGKVMQVLPLLTWRTVCWSKLSSMMDQKSQRGTHLPRKGLNVHLIFLIWTVVIMKSSYFYKYKCTWWFSQYWKRPSWTICKHFPQPKFIEWTGCNLCRHYKSVISIYNNNDCKISDKLKNQLLQ